MNLKQTIVALVALASTVSAFAGIEVRLERAEKIRTKAYKRGVFLDKVVVLPAGTIVEYAERRGLGMPAGTRFMKDNGAIRTSNSPWKRVLNIELQRGSLRHLAQNDRRYIKRTVNDINEFGAKNRGDDRDGYTAYYISQWSVENMATPVMAGSFDDEFDSGSHTSIDAPNYIDDGSYEVCYQNVEEKWSTDGKQAIDGFFQTLVGGAVAAVGVDILTNADSFAEALVGGIFTGIGGAVAIEGIAKHADAYKLESIQYNGQSCKTYYRPTTRRTVRHAYNRDMRSCTSYEYQSTSWHTTTYYYETTCNRNGSSHTFYQYSETVLY